MTIIDNLLRPAQRTQAPTAPVSNRARIWTLIVACVGVTVVIAAMDSSLLVLGLIIAVAAFVIGGWAPGRDGQQLRLVRWLVTGRREAAERDRADVS